MLLRIFFGEISRNNFILLLSICVTKKYVYLLSMVQVNADFGYLLAYSPLFLNEVVQFRSCIGMTKVKDYRMMMDEAE